MDRSKIEHEAIGENNVMRPFVKFYGAFTDQLMSNLTTKITSIEMSGTLHFQEV